MERTPCAQKEAEIVRLYTIKKLGAKAVARYYNNRPSRSTIIKILHKHGVYRGEESACKPDESRRQLIQQKEHERRDKLATCLRALRKGGSVEGVCREQGWNMRTVWSSLRTRSSYQSFKHRRIRKYPEQLKARTDGFWLSKQYPKERKFQESIRKILDEAKSSYFVEPSIKGLRVRGDFLVDSVLVECKVDVSHNGMTKALGQCWFYQTHTPYNCLLVVPDDVVPHEAWVVALRRMGATLLNETSFLCWVRGELSFDPVKLRNSLKTK